MLPCLPWLLRAGGMPPTYTLRPLLVHRRLQNSPPLTGTLRRPESVCKGHATSPQKPWRTVYWGLLGLVDTSPSWLSELGILGACLSRGNLKSWGTRYWVQTLHSSEKNWELGVAFRLQVALLGLEMMERLCFLRSYPF